MIINLALTGFVFLSQRYSVDTHTVNCLTGIDMIVFRCVCHRDGAPVMVCMPASFFIYTEMLEKTKLFAKSVKSDSLWLGQNVIYNLIVSISSTLNLVIRNLCVVYLSNYYEFTRRMCFALNSGM